MGRNRKIPRPCVECGNFKSYPCNHCKRYVCNKCDDRADYLYTCMSCINALLFLGKLNE